MRASRALLCAIALAGASSAACSAIYGGGRYTGGGGEDDAGPSGDDAFVPSDEDSGTPVDAATPIDANEVIACTDDRACGADEFCDSLRGVCARCDADGDGVLHQACVMRAGGLAWDCDPDRAAEARTLRATSFAHTLRAYLGPSALHVFYVSDDASAGGVRYASFGDGAPRDQLLQAVAPPGMAVYDAARIGPDRVVLAGYDAAGAQRYDLESDAISLKATRAFGDLASMGYMSLVPSGPAMLVNASDESAFIGFSASWGSSMGGRVVLDVGGDSFLGSHISTFHERGASPSAVRFASGPSVVLMPNDTGDSNPFLLWAGDLRDFGSNHDPQPFDVGSLQVGQLAVTRLEGGQSIIALGAVGVGAGRVRLALGIASCNSGDLGECAFTTSSSSPQLEVEGMGQATIAGIGVSPRSVFMATTAADGFRVGNLELCPPATACPTPMVPAEPIGTMSIPAPSLPDTRAVAVDLRGNPATGTLTLGLARASAAEIQAIRLDLCFAPDP